MADNYWKFVLGGVTPAKYASIEALLLSKPADSTIFVTHWDGSAVLTIGFGGSDVTATKAWIQNSIVTPLGLLTSTNQAIAVGTLCKTAADTAAGL